MTEAKLIYNYLQERIPGIEVFIGYGSEFSKSSEQLEKLKTERKLERRHFKGITLPFATINEILWKKDEDQYDCLILCDSVREAFTEGLKVFPECHTERIAAGIDSKEDDDLTKHTNVIYMTYVYIEPIKRYIKIGFCDYTETLNSMITFDSQYIPFRLLKKCYITKSTPMFDDALYVCRGSFDLVAALLEPELYEPLSNHYERVYGSSYKNDVRNGIAEAPDKLEKLLANQEEHLDKYYGRIMHTREVCEIDGISMEYVKKKIPRNWYFLLPEAFKNVVRSIKLVYSDLSSYEDRVKLAAAFSEYIDERNKLESRTQPLRGLHSTGVVNTVAYGLRKINKATKR